MKNNLSMIKTVFLIFSLLYLLGCQNTLSEPQTFKVRFINNQGINDYYMTLSIKNSDAENNSVIKPIPLVLNDNSTDYFTLDIGDYYYCESQGNIIYWVYSIETIPFVANKKYKFRRIGSSFEFTEE